MAPDLKVEKKALRTRILAQRDALDPRTRTAHARRIFERLLSLPAYRSAQAVAGYVSFGSEVDTASLLEDALRNGRQLVLPRIDKPNRRLELRRVSSIHADLVAGVWGIREPAGHCPLVPVSQVDFMLVPGVAFTRQGDRLGYGGGYYDRLMTGLRADVPRIAAAFSLQIVDALPTDERDQRVTSVVTEA